MCVQTQDILHVHYHTPMPGLRLEYMPNNDLMAIRLSAWAMKVCTVDLVYLGDNLLKETTCQCVPVLHFLLRTGA